MNDLKKIRGAKRLGKTTQQAIKAGRRFCASYAPCPTGWECLNSECVRLLV